MGHSGSVQYVLHVRLDYLNNWVLVETIEQTSELTTTPVSLAKSTAIVEFPLFHGSNTLGAMGEAFRRQARHLGSGSMSPVVTAPAILNLPSFSPVLNHVLSPIDISHPSEIIIYYQYNKHFNALTLVSLTAARHAKVIDKPEK